MKKHLLIFTLSIFALTSFSQTPQSRATLKTAPYSLINGQVPKNTTSVKYLDNFLQSYWNTTDDGTPLINTTGWTLSGNALGNNTSWLGSSDNRSLIFKTNNIKWWKFDSVGVQRTYTTSAIPTINGSSYYSVLDGITSYIQDDANWMQTWTNGVHKLSIYLATSTGTNAVSAQLYTQGSTALGIGSNNKQGILIEPNNGLVGIGNGLNRSNVNGILHIYSGTSSIPAIALTAQTAVTTPTNGNIWYTTATGFNLFGIGSHIGPAARQTQTTVAQNRISNSTSSILDIGSNGVANGLYMWADRPGSKTATNYNVFMDEFDNIFNDSSSFQCRFNNTSVLNITNLVLNSGSTAFFRLTPNSSQRSTLAETRGFTILASTQGFGAGGTLATMNRNTFEATTYTSSSGSTLTTVAALVAKKGIAGSGVTITNNFGFLTDGGAKIDGGIYGTQTNDNATDGYVGQYIESYIAVGSAITLTTGVAVNITTISLTAGDWDVEGNINFNESSATMQARSGGITSTSATIPTDGKQCYDGANSTLLSELNTITVPRRRFSLSATTTIYLVTNVTFVAGSATAFGGLNARRIR